MLPSFISRQTFSWSECSRYEGTSSDESLY
jgi:hypothetical protein